MPTSICISNDAGNHLCFFTFISVIAHHTVHKCTNFPYTVNIYHCNKLIVEYLNQHFLYKIALISLFTFEILVRMRSNFTMFPSSSLFDSGGNCLVLDYTTMHLEAY